jgi:hypothetical protein
MTEHLPNDYREWADQKTYEIIMPNQIRHEVCRYSNSCATKDTKQCRQCIEEKLYESNN